jgi:SAM-dependent methyltransferase
VQPAAYDEMRALEDHHWWFRGKRTVLGPVIRAAAAAAPPGPVVDLGCGTGGNLRHIGELGLGRAAIGVDADPRALFHCAGRGLTRIVRAEGRLPFADGSIALVTAFDVLEHVEDDFALLREIRRVLAPGGALVASVPAYPWLWSRHDVVLGHVRRYRTGELQRRIAEAGFEVERSHGFNFLLLPLIALVRFGARRRAGDDAGTDFFEAPKPLNAALSALFAVERALLAVVPVPFGVSFVVRSRAPSRIVPDSGTLVRTSAPEWRSPGPGSG